MPKLVELQALRRTAQRRAGLRGRESVSPADWTDIVNSAISQMWRQMTKSATGFGEATVEFDTVADQDIYALPVDHMQTVGLYRPRQAGETDRWPAKKTTRRAYRDRYPADAQGNQIARPGIYWYTPTQIVVRPIPTSVETLELIYITTPPVLSADTDTIDVVADLDEAIIWLAVGEAHQDGRKRADALARGQRVVETAVASWAANRDRQPTYIKDVRRDQRRRRRGLGLRWL